MDLHIEEKGVTEPLDLDEAILRAQGHDVQLERSFSWMGALGLAFRFSPMPPDEHESMLTLLAVSSTPG